MIKDRDNILDKEKSTEEHYVIRDGVKEIEDGAFYGCTSLKNIEIPNSVTRIGRETFQGCSSLESIEIPNSIIIIGDLAFRGCM